MIYQIKFFGYDAIPVEITDKDEKIFEQRGWNIYKHRAKNYEISDLLQDFYNDKNDYETNVIMFKWLAKHNIVHHYNLKLMNEFRRVFSS
jgi:hypothetical protein